MPEQSELSVAQRKNAIRPVARRGKQPRSAYKPVAAAEGAADAVDVYSIREFCQRHAISPSFFFKLKKQGLAPATMKLGSRTLVTAKAAAAWRDKQTKESI